MKTIEGAEARLREHLEAKRNQYSLAPSEITVLPGVLGYWRGGGRGWCLAQYIAKGAYFSLTCLGNVIQSQRKGRVSTWQKGRR